MKANHKCLNRFTHAVKKAGVSLCLYGALMSSAVTTLHAAEFRVVDRGDTIDNGSRLVEAIQLANDNDEADTIILTPGATYTLEAIAQTSTDLGTSDLAIGASGLPFIESIITISGGKTDSGLTTIERSALSGVPEFRIFTVISGTLRLEEVEITGGVEFIGGGIYNSAGRVELSHSTITSNTALIDGGGIYNDIYAPKAAPEPPRYEIGYITVTDS